MMFFLLIYEKGRQSLDLIESSPFSFMATRNLVFSGSLLLMAHLKKQIKQLNNLGMDVYIHLKIPQIRLWVWYASLDHGFWLTASKILSSHNDSKRLQPPLKPLFSFRDTKSMFLCKKKTTKFIYVCNMDLFYILMIGKFMLDDELVKLANYKNLT